MGVVEMSGLISDRIQQKECMVGLTNRQEAKLKVADIKRAFSFRLTRMDKISKEYIRWTAQVEQLGVKVRKKAEVMWMHWEKDVEYEASRQDEQTETIDKIYGWSV